MTIVNPVAEIVKKLRLDSDVTARVVSSHIHAGYPKIINGSPVGVDTPGIYVHRVTSEMFFVYGPAMLADAPKYGNARYQIDVFSAMGTSDSDEIAALSIMALGESVADAHLYSIYYYELESSYDDGFDCYHSIFQLVSRIKTRPSGVTLLG